MTVKKILKFFYLILFLPGSLAIGQGNKINITQFDLNNGLHVILHQDKSRPIIAINVLYHVGSKNENPDRTGFAHFFEHLMFEGSDNIARGEYFKYVQNAGGENNAWTTFDYTNYYEVLPSNQLQLGLWLESERMMHLRVDSIGVETQRKVVKEERKLRYENQPYGSFLEEIFSNAFQVIPYHWVPIGNVQYIDQAKLSEFMSFYKTYYVPDNAVLVIAGDLDINKTKDWVAKYFEGIPKGQKMINRPKGTEPPQNQETRKTVYDHIQLPGIFEAYRIPSQSSVDYYALQMLQNYLSEGQSSILYKTLVDEQKKALQVTAFSYSLENAGLFITLAIANTGIEPKDLEQAMETEISKVKTNVISDETFQKIRNQVETAFVTKNSTMSGIASNLAQYYTFFNDPNLINTELTKYMKVTKEDIQRVAKTYLNKENRVILYYLPKSQNQKEDK